MGLVERYGSPVHAESMMVLKPEEWIRVRANVWLLASPRKPVTALFRGGFGYRRNTFNPVPGG
jgi:hypothetical protein